MTWYENGQPADKFTGEWKDGKILEGILEDTKTQQEYNINNRDD